MVSRKSVICAGGGGGLRETGGLYERGAYHGGISSDLEYKVEKLQVQEVGGHGAEDQKQIHLTSC